MLRILCDADDVFFPFAPNIIDFYNKRHGTHFTMADFTDYNPNVMWGCSGEEADDIIIDFAHSDEAANLPPIAGAFEVLSRLKENHELGVLTARFTENRRTMTLSWLDRFLPQIFAHEHVYFTNDLWRLGRPACKSVVCRELSADIIIDDRYFYIERCASIGIEAILFQPDEYCWNRLPAKLPPHAHRAKNWWDVERIVENLDLQKTVG